MALLGVVLVTIQVFHPGSHAQLAPPPPPKRNVVAISNGKSMNGWRSPVGNWKLAGAAVPDPADPKKLKLEPGTGVLVNGDQGQTQNLFSRVEHSDVMASIEFMVPLGSNSGVYFQGRYEVQILDSWAVKDPKFGDCGGIYERHANGKGFEGRSPNENASKPPGQWQKFIVTFRAPRFDKDGRKVENARFVKVMHNGRVIHENIEVTGPTRSAAFDDEKPTGPIMLQGDHGPVAFRRIILKPVRLD